MGVWVHQPTSRLVGRVDEQDRLRRALAGAAAGEPCAVLVRGEAGIGKTRLVREALDAVDAEVLWGTCVHFGASSLPFAPLVTALRSWLLQAPASRRDHVLAGNEDLEGLLPGVLGATVPPGRLLPLLDTVLSRLAEQQLTVLVVDDLQWADASSLDALAYVIAGFRGQRVAVVVTCREEHRPEGHPLHGWLADMLRMPSFTAIRLGRLDLLQTEDLVSQLLGRRVDVDLAAAVLERSGGNPYLIELLVRGLDADARELPATAPGELREALSAQWHALSPPARDLVRILAVGGRPQRFDVLVRVAAAHGRDEAVVSSALDEAATGGVVREERGRFWFRHPLLSEILYDDMPAGRAAAVHGTYAAVLETMSTEHEARLAADLAVHHERAGNVDQAFRWSLHAADHAAQLRASVEEAAHLVRACELWPRAGEGQRGTTADRVGLLSRASRVCARVSRYDDALRLLEDARVLVDERTDPLLASRVLTQWCDTSWQRSGPGRSRMPEHGEALRLTDGYPDSVERVQALAEMAEAESWDGDVESAGVHADEALAVARRTGSDLALASALNTWASVQPVMGEEALAAVEEALRLARAVDDVDEVVAGVIWLLNGLDGWDRQEQAADVGQRAFAEVVGAGDVHWAYFVAGMTADFLVGLGRWDEARDLLREGLGVRSVGIPGAMTRLVAALLAVRAGDVGASRQHLDRALELVDPDFSGLRDGLIGVASEVLLAENRPHEALTWVRDRLLAGGPLDQRCRPAQLVHLARVVAVLVQEARDAGDEPAAARLLDELDAWVERFTAVLPTLADPQDCPEHGDYLLAVAEVARCHHDADELELWERAVAQARPAGLAWIEANALLRWAEAAVRRHQPRDEMAVNLRRAHRLATGMGAKPLAAHVEFLATSARVGLQEPPNIPAQANGERRSRLSELTDREREILGHVVAGRTNGEIARSLVISDKTVSVHVSNILRKTGTSSRAEAAALARRLL